MRKGLGVMDDAPVPIVVPPPDESSSTGSKPTAPEQVIQATVRLNADGTLVDDTALKAREANVGINSEVSPKKAVAGIPKTLIGVVVETLFCS